MPTTPKPSLSRQCARVSPAGPWPTTRTSDPSVGQGVGAVPIQRVEAGEQAVDFKAVGEGQHLGQYAGFDLKDIHRLLSGPGPALRPLGGGRRGRSDPHRSAAHLDL
jgi:hypothetical protein